jgi:hypothetical protein
MLTRRALAVAAGLAAIVVALSTGFAVMARMRRAAMEEECRNNLRMLHVAAQNAVIRDNCAARFPALTGGEFVEALAPYVASPSTLACPVARGRDNHYLGPAINPNQLRDDEVLIMDAWQNHRGGAINGVTRGGTVVQLSSPTTAARP